ncbi:spike base protein, RCAP_Rcc01079 family [Phaeovulum sp. W22_SRMD_FR3]|uniref:spike base protein, RCAP_Rcc01079 family n=1 Tax=Phaeovulum sp. W22_SRMD_FR3 TaxID=3240274 RepID=UPI003F967BB8
MADLYASHARGLQSPATQHFAITPANGANLPNRPRVLKVLTAGTVALRDSAGVVLIYPVQAGELLQFSAMGVEATGTTATVVGWL